MGHIVENWRKITHHFEDDKLWEVRKSIVGFSIDNDFENYLKCLDHKRDKETQNFLDEIYSCEREIRKAEIKKLISEDVDLLQHSLFIITQYTLNKLINLLSKNNSNLKISDHVSYELAEKFRHEVKKMIQPTIYYEYHVYLKAYDLDNNRENTLYFVSEVTNSKDWMDYYSAAYPVLFKKLMQLSINLLNNLETIIDNLHKDYSKLIRQFKIDSNTITSINPFLGDPHNRGKSTCLIELKQHNGSKHEIYYKNRNMKSDLMFNELISFLNKLGLQKSIQKTEVIARNDYGWQKGIKHNEVTTKKGISKFYYNQGINAALAYIFNIQDLIADNIIADGEYPIFFDLEMIFMPKFKNSSHDYRLQLEAGRVFNEGILQTGLIPTFGFQTLKEEGHSNAGLSKLSENTYYGFKNINNIRKKISSKVYSQDFNLPKYMGETYVVDDFCKDVEEGFAYAYKFIEKHKKIIKNKVKSIFSEYNPPKIRILIRYTYIYTGLINESYNPKYMSSNFEYRKFLELLWRGYNVDIRTGAVIQDEINQIVSNDIPYFYTFPQDKNLYSNNRCISTNFFEKDGLSEVIYRIDSLNKEDLISQVNLIRRAFIIHSKYDTNIIFKREPKKNNLKIENKIGNFLLNLNSNSDSDKYFTYIDYTITKGGLWDQGVQHPSIFQGTEGLGVYFCALYATNKDKKYLIAAKKILNQSVEYILFNEKTVMDSPAPRIGLSNYPICTLYTHYLYDKILGDESPALNKSFIEFIIKYVNKKYSQDRYFDYLSGSTGLLFLLLEYRKKLNHYNLDALIHRISENLIGASLSIENDKITWSRNSFDKWGGFAHGNSSTSYLFFKIAEFSNDEKYFDMGIKALNYDQALYDHSQFRWRKSIDFEGDLHYGWATGSAGIGLSRKFIQKHYLNDFLLEEIEIAKNHIEQSIMDSLNYDISICSGSLGMFEVGKILGIKKSIQNDFKKKLTSVIENNNIENIPYGGWEKKQLMTGLYYGLAGVGYNYLKMLKNNSLPSIIYI